MADKRLNIILSIKGAKKAEQEMSALGKATKLAAGFFSIQLARSVAAAGIELSKLSGEAEGVKNAFNKLNNPALLGNLRSATKNTVSDLQLMKSAVQANNFQIPVESLAKLFEFANRRARDTGESVDYLVQSIVLGIGRKSPLILDNLGISAIRLREVLKGAGTEVSTVADVAAAVGKIAQEEMGKSGDVVLTAKDKWQQLGATIDNIKVKSGDFLNTIIFDVTGLGKALDETARAQETLNYFTNIQIGQSKNYAQLMARLNAEQRVQVSLLDGSISKKIELAKALDNENRKIIEQAKKYAEWREKQLQKIEADKQEYEWTVKLNQELLRQEFGIRTISNATADRIESQKEVIKQIGLISESSREMSETYINDVAEGIISRNQAIAMSFANNLGGALSDALVRGTNTLQALERAFKATLARMAAELLAKSAIFGLFSIFGGGDLLGGSLSKFLFGGGRASGGPVNSNKAYVVGEKGPELFVPKTSGTIIPNNQIANNYTINLSGPIMGNARDIARQLQPELMKLQMGRA